jgi:hypothetical protein
MNEENKKNVLTRVKTGVVVKIALAALGIGVLAVAVVNLKSKANKEVAVSFNNLSNYIIDTSAPEDINFGQKEITFLAMEASSQKDASVSEIAFSGAFNAPVENMQLVKVDYDEAGNKFVPTVVGISAKLTQKAGANVAVFGNLALKLSAKPVTLLLRGDLSSETSISVSATTSQFIPTVQFMLKNSGDIKVTVANTKPNKLKVTADVIGPLMKIVGEKPTQITVSDPVGGKDYSKGKTQSIMWKATNSTGQILIPVGVFLMQEEIIAGMKTEKLIATIEWNVEHYDGTYFNWKIPDSISGNNYYIKVNCGFGDNIPSVCNAGRSGLFNIK